MRRLAATLALTLALAAGGAHASQQYEPLADSVRAALHLAISDRAAPDLPAFSSPQKQLWLSTMSERLAKRMPDDAGRMEFLKTVHYEATRAGLDPHAARAARLVPAGVFVEGDSSGCVLFWSPRSLKTLRSSVSQRRGIR